MSPGDGRLTMDPPLLALACNELYAADCASKELKIMYRKKNKEWAVIERLPEMAHNMDSWGITFRGRGDHAAIAGLHVSLLGSLLGSLAA
ncbi:hypothetical protein HanRHA438_Chr04g0163671 [Helianthus annuus]|nr:hypothetical protein HanIR_Chr04g0165351 [Helianthus annuus]KAJ0596115.1 hypothetical protein HanHA89_Chr04g0139101 [Helianthus annuus]KAJ0756766.1 hypothetical protein HanLR1_Chr04g0130851 [Helianthus annuus]KAJ0760515.1 hypothetical protein HanOQP8_Chr04g0138881 [Helianthus annuus]KAJ0925789.1 hypothetical protein HanRHA438_Chr04g0163671 [Helianthus annuus]